jgi:hypothetical protein
MSTSTVETDRLVRVFIKIRAARSDLKRTFETEDGELKGKLRQVENELLRRALEQGLKGFNTNNGTTYVKEEQHVSIADPDDFMEFVKEEGDLYFYEQRPSLGHVREYQKAHDGELPPGIRMFRENRMRVRATNKKGEEDDD